MPAPRPMRATLADVARYAGVSLGSASRVMHAPDSVRPATREAVQRAAADLGYVPDGRARALASGRSMMVGIVLPTISNPVYAQFVHVLQRGLAGQGYMLVVQAHEYDRGAEAAQVRALAGRGLDAMVLIGTDHERAVLDVLAYAEVPHLFVWSADDAPAHRCIGFSNRAAMRQMAEHLIGLGHRRLGVISGAIAGNERARARLAGVEDALAAIGLPPPLVTCQPFSLAGGRAGLADLLARDPQLTAVLCATDLMAAGALAQARDARIAVPDRLSITGFDDIDLAADLAPALTTMRAPIAEMGEQVAAAVLALLRGDPPAETVVLPVDLVVRQSSGVAPR